MGLVLAGCSKPAAPAGPSTAARTPTAPPATPASSPPAVVIAPPAPDAVLAGAGDLKVLVPSSLLDDSDPAAVEALVQAIDKEVKAAARSKKPAGRIVIYADTTVDYGCRCPPFVFSPLYGSGRPEAYVLPIFAKGVPEPFPTKLGLFRFAGHFDGRRITGIEWLEQRGGEPEEGMSEYEHKAPVFIVEGWCFEPADTSPEIFTEERYGSDLKSLAEEGRFCPTSASAGPPSKSK